MAEGNSTMVVFAYGKEDDGLPWIYGLYSDHSQGLDVQEEMQRSKDYGHLTWSNSIKYIE